MVRPSFQKLGAAAFFFLLQRVNGLCHHNPSASNSAPNTNYAAAQLPTSGTSGVDASAGGATTIIERDVVILGGGAAGAYSAVRLKDANKTVAVIDRDIKLGGHVDTFIPPGGGPIEYGVQAYIDNDQTRNFFNRFGVELNASGLSPFPSRLADFSTGFVIPNATAPNPFDYITPLINYLGTISSLFPFLSEGAYDIPSPVPEDLLLPFGTFLSKYNLTEVVPVVWIFAQGVGNLLEATTLNVLQNFGQPHISGLAAGYLYAPSGHQTLYDLAAEFIGSDNLFLGSKATSVTRSEQGVEVVVDGAVIRAKKILVTIPPTLDNLAPFELSEAETDVFSKWLNVPYFVGVTSGTGLADLTNYLNANLSSPYGLPSTPFVWRLETTGQSGYQTVKVIGEPSSDSSKSLLDDAVGKLAKNGSAPVLDAWEEHDNLQLHFSPEDIRGGVYGDLYALQGQQSTVWAGNAWCSDYSPLIWAFIENRTLPALLK